MLCHFNMVSVLHHYTTRVNLITNHYNVCIGTTTTLHRFIVDITSCCLFYKMTTVLPVICHYTITLVRMFIQRSMCILSARTCTTCQYPWTVQYPPAVRDNIHVLHVQMATRNTYTYSAWPSKRSTCQHSRAARSSIYVQCVPICSMTPLGRQFSQRRCPVIDVAPRVGYICRDVEWK